MAFQAVVAVNLGFNISFSRHQFSSFANEFGRMKSLFQNNDGRKVILQTARIAKQWWYFHLLQNRQGFLAGVRIC